MLERAHIYRFRSCVDVIIKDIPPALALVGRNGAGKTNIMQAIAWAAAHAVTPAGDADSRTVLNINNAYFPHIALDVRLKGRLYRYEVLSGVEVNIDAPSRTKRRHEETLSVFEADTNVWRPLITRKNDQLSVPGWESSLRIAHDIPCLAAVAALRPDDAVVQATRPLHTFLSKVRYNALDEPSTSNDVGFVDSDDYSSWRATSPRPDSIPMRLIEASRENPEAFTELQQILGPNGLDLINPMVVQEHKFPLPKKSGSPTGRAETTLFFVLLRPSMGPAPPPDQAHFPGTFRYGELSLGTRRVLRVLVSLLLDDHSLVLLEQPEDSIHQALLRKLIRILKKNTDRARLIIASHSPVVFNAMEPSEIRLVAMDNGRTTARALTEQELDAAQRFMEREGPLSDFIDTVDESPS